ncbi:hypothetical protein PTKIN_Ptkin15bG0125300 [Pterospermum kingtungense]
MKAEKIRLRRPWSQTLIIKVMGRSVGYNYLNRLKVLWKPKSAIDLIALENEYFLVKFSSLEDYDFAKYEGPWMFLDHYLIVKEWSPNFDPMTDSTEKLLVWVRFPCLPIEYYDYDFLMKVGEKIERPVRIDEATSIVSSGKFARMCVEVDITKPLLARFKLRRMTSAFTSWNVDTFGNIFKRKRRLLARLKGIQQVLAISSTHRLLKLECKLQKKLDEVLKQEKVLRFQQSREEWIVFGDLNTKFYHASTVIRRSRCLIVSLQDVNGNWVKDSNLLKGLVQDYFCFLFQADESCDLSLAFRGGFPRMSGLTEVTLNAPFTKEEVREAVFAMSPYKAAGPDGFHVGFFQRCWNIVEGFRQPTYVRFAMIK